MNVSDRFLGLLARVPKFGPRACHGIGRRQLASGASQAAIDSFEVALAAGLPAQSGIFHDLGVACRNAGRLQEAEIHWRSAIAARPDANWSFQELGAALIDMERLDEAEAILLQGLALHASNRWLYYHSSRCAFAQHRIERAVDLMIEGWKKPGEGRLPPLPFSRNPIVAGQCTEARKSDLRRIIQDHPDADAPMDLLAWMLLQCGQFAEATVLRQRMAEVSRDARWAQRAAASAPNLKAVPDFLIIGQGKAGTSALYACLCQHPQVVAATTKEVEFWSLYYPAGEAWYRSHFMPLPLGSDLVTGEASVAYLTDADAAQRIARALPQVRLIVMLREPVARAWSMYQMNRRTGVEHREWEDIVASELSGVASCPLSMAELRAELPTAKHRNYFLMSAPLPFLHHWLTLFPRRQMLILQYADFNEDGAAVMNRIHRFLGLQPHATDCSARINAGHYPPMNPDLEQRLHEWFRPHEEALAAFLADWKKTAPELTAGEY